MSDNSKDNNDKPNIISFPDDKKRRDIKNDKKSKDKETKKEQKERERLEAEYREQYRKERAARARMQSHIAQKSASGKQPFINWEKIPPFSRYTVATFIIIHIALTFFVTDTQSGDIKTLFGFVPAYYSGTIPWGWNALIAPITTFVLHGNWTHLFTNCVMMLAMGIFFERQFGAKASFIVFMICGLGGDMFYFLFSPASVEPVIGASGAISGFFAIMLMQMNLSGMAGPLAQKRGPLPILLIWITIMILIGMLISNIAWQSHLGGFLTGIAIFQLWRKGKIRL